MSWIDLIDCKRNKVKIDLTKIISIAVYTEEKGDNFKISFVNGEDVWLSYTRPLAEKVFNALNDAIDRINDDVDKSYRDLIDKMESELEGADG